MANKQFEPQEWIVAFFDKGEGFFDKFLWKGSKYRHIALFFKRKLGWYMINPHPNYWRFEELELMASKDFEKHIFLIKNCFCWMKVLVQEPGSPVSPLILPTCIEVVKGFMGVKCGSCISVHGFYKSLLKYDIKSNYKIIKHEVKNGRRRN